MGKSETFIAAIAAIGQDFAASLEKAKLQVCLFPPKPCAIAEKQRAQAAFDAFQITKRTPGMSFCYGEALALNHVGACIKDALFAHRLMVAGNTAAQTFGGVL